MARVVAFSFLNFKRHKSYQKLRVTSQQNSPHHEAVDRLSNITFKRHPSLIPRKETRLKLYKVNDLGGSGFNADAGSIFLAGPQPLVNFRLVDSLHELATVNKIASMYVKHVDASLTVKGLSQKEIGKQIGLMCNTMYANYKNDFRK